MDSFSEDTGSFPRRCATVSVITPVLMIAIGVFVQPFFKGHVTGQIILGTISILLIIAGFVLGVVALANIKRHGTEGILWQALLGTVMNGLFALSLLMVAIVTSEKGQWHELLNLDTAQLNYDKNGVQFSYGNGWTVIEEEPTAASQAAITIQRQANGANIFIGVYAKTVPPPNFEDYGRKLIQDAGGVAEPTTERITGKIGGMDVPGLRFHFSSPRLSGVVFTGDFYRLETTKHNVIMDALTLEDADTVASMKAILASVKIDGESCVAADNTSPASTSTATTSADTKSEGFFIPAKDRVDMVQDGKRNILYITAGDSVLRYQLDTKSFLSPLTLGGNLRGIDISPDNSHIAVADAAGGNGRVRIHVVDLETGADTPASFTAETLESGTYSVAYGADGQVWISSSLNGSGALPMRKYNPPTRSAVTLQRVSQDTMLTASADRQCIGFAEAMSMPGEYGRILYRAAQLPSQPMRTDGYLYEVAISRDGSQLAVPGHDGMTLAGVQESMLAEQYKLAEREILGVVYHPQRNYLFVSKVGTSLISVYDTSNYTEVKDLDFGDQFDWTGHAYGAGRLKMSQDGFYVFCTVKGGIRYMAAGL